MNRKFICLLILAALPLLAFSERDNKDDHLYSGGFILGIGYGQIIKAMDGEILAGYCDKNFIVEIGYSYLKFELDPRFTIEYTVNSVSGRLGLRNRIHDSNLFISYGATGNYGFLSDEVDTTVLKLKRPYGIGGYIGLEYQLTEHYLISAKSNVYSYAQTVYKDGIKHQVFGTQTVSFSYVF